MIQVSASNWLNLRISRQIKSLISPSIHISFHSWAPFLQSIAAVGLQPPFSPMSRQDTACPPSQIQPHAAWNRFLMSSGFAPGFMNGSQRPVLRCLRCFKIDPITKRQLLYLAFSLNYSWNYVKTTKIICTIYLDRFHRNIPIHCIQILDIGRRASLGHLCI